MEDRIVYVCGCSSSKLLCCRKPGTWGIWTADDVGVICDECGTPVERINIDALLRVAGAEHRVLETAYSGETVED